MVNMYAFGATLAYLLSFVALIALRAKDPYTPRPYKMPFNIIIKGVQVPVLGITGLIATFGMLIVVLWTHELGRVAGPGWILAWLGYYFWFRWREGLPLLGSSKRNWEKDQIAILTSAEEFDLLEQYKSALEERDRKLKHAAPR